MRIGFARLGRIGTHMACNLAFVGHVVIIWIRNPDKLAQFFQDNGFAVALLPIDLAKRADNVVKRLQALYNVCR